MKKLIFLFTGILSVLLIVSSIVLFQACSTDEIFGPNSPRTGSMDYESCLSFNEAGAQVDTMWGGKTIYEGIVKIWNTTDNGGVPNFMYIKLLPNITFNDLHYYVTTDPLTFPVNDTLVKNGNKTETKCNPKLNMFVHPTLPLTNNTIIIDLNSLTYTMDRCLTDVYVFIHLAMSDGETAWVGDMPFGKWGNDQYTWPLACLNRWGLGLKYNLCCPDPPNPPGPPNYINGETGFVKVPFVTGEIPLDPDSSFYGLVFTTENKSNPEGYPTLGLSRNRWGWAGYINYAAIPAGGYTWNVYCGAGLNKVPPGYLTATVKLEQVSGGNIKVTSTANSGYGFIEIHTYAGAMPTTLAPGQYTYVMTEPANPINVWTSTEPIVLDGHGYFYFIGHAVVGVEAKK